MSSNNALSQIKTKEELDSFKEGINALIAASFKVDKEKFANVLKQSFDQNQAGIIEQEIKGIDSAELVDNSLRELLKNINQIEEVKLLLAFSPKLAFIERLSFWFKNQFGQNTMLDISVDPAILGGTIVAYKGKYIDLSLAKELDEYFIKNHDKIKSKF
ncbi:MAG: hypothetical protein US96_C0023G0006 [Candidatus Woesebacteria bacterium GW2011_GWB1_38_5b]|uniref:Uncharacterized protein n=1 Tax=Candidatus Woesebacteria bacterium GW2011_GWB1_38_5b TaxID=1618569 RepID=A0A0G0K7N9_9BACT|nr:MAG: hypothetical protein US96_C0023G0006 [Candidatus Woesebacteria bacterium GW2011_GWB1_38_5b]